MIAQIYIAICKPYRYASDKVVFAIRMVVVVDMVVVVRKIMVVRKKSDLSRSQLATTIERSPPDRDPRRHGPPCRWRISPLGK